MTAFADFSLSPALLKALDKAGFTAPTPVQTAAIPPQLQGRDVLALAQTGTGKTAAFALPLIEALAGRSGRRPARSGFALILAPTRELAVQIDAELRRFGAAMAIRTVLVLGGMSRHKQVKTIAAGVDVIIATPGRLMDLLNERDATLSAVETLVLDEADRMLDMGFIRDIRKIAAMIPAGRRTALFSATMPPEIETLANELLREPARVEVAPQGTTVQKIAQRLVQVPAGAKRGALTALLADKDMSKVIVFARTKRGADRVAKGLEADGVRADAIHGDKAQNARQRALESFRTGAVRVLVATDIAARGIDVAGVTHVVNYDLPDEPESYTHRIGRTGRNGADGQAISLCDETERDKLRAIEKLIRRAFLPCGSLGDHPPAAHPRPEQAKGKRPSRGRGRAPRRAAA